MTNYLRFLEQLRKYKFYAESGKKGIYYLGISTTKYLRIIENKWMQLTGLSPTTLPTLVDKRSIEKEVKQFSLDTENIFYCKQYAIKPTSEALLYDSTFFKNFCRRRKDLPHKLLAFNRVYRVEDRSQAFLRNTEIYGFTQIHEVHPIDENIKPAIDSAVSNYKKLFEFLDVPTITLHRPENDRFTGAIDTIAFDTVIDNKRLQLATIHDLGTNWSKLYCIQYLHENNLFNCHQICYGHSERVVFATLYHHYDSTLNRLVLPTRLRLVFALFVEVNGYHIQGVDIRYEVQLKNLKKYIEMVCWQHGIVLVIDYRHKDLAVINGTEKIYLPLSSAIQFICRLKKGTDTICNMSKNIFDKYKLYGEYNKMSRDILSPIWGLDESNTCYYGGPSF